MVLAGGPDFPVPSLVGPNISTMSYVVRTTISSSELMPLVQRATHSVDPQLALAQVRTLQDVLDRASAQMAFTMVLVAIAASVALMLGMIGIFGVMSYVVTQRTGEIGVRLARRLLRTNLHRAHGDVHAPSTLTPKASVSC
jgi:hypothetical protein